MKKKNKGGRPTKLTPKLIAAMSDVVLDNNALYLTDEDLIFLLNEKLPEDDRIAIQTFKDYKAGRRQQNSPLIEEFATLIKKALGREKQNLLKDVRAGVLNWQSRAWILERKFKEWNLKQISETDITSKGKSLKGQKTVIEFINAKKNR